MASYNFGGATGLSYADLLQRRQNAQALADTSNMPMTVAGGLGAIGQAFIAKHKRQNAEKALAERNSQFRNMLIGDAYQRSQMTPSGSPVTPQGRATANALVQQLGGTPAPSRADQLLALAADERFSEAQRNLAMQLYANEIKPGPAQYETVQNPYGLGGVGQKNTQTGEISGYQKPAAPKNRQTIEGADGYQYFVDTGKRVLPDVQKSVDPVDAASFGGTPIYGQYNGNLVVGQLNDQGGVRWDNVPESDMGKVQVVRPIKTIDQGTSTALVNSMTGDVTGSLDKNVEEAAAESAIGTAAGKDQADAVIDYPRILSNAQNMIDVLDKAIDHPGLAGAVGPVQGNVSDMAIAAFSGDAANFITIANQLQGKTFLEAYQSLKGGGQITEVEGKKAENAIARLDRAQTEDSYRSALKDLREVIINSTNRARKKAADAGGTDLDELNTGAAPTRSKDDILRQYGVIK